MVLNKFGAAGFSVAKHCKAITGLFLLVALPTTASANNLCPTVFPDPEIRIGELRPRPNDQWGIGFFGPGVAGESTVNEGDRKFQFGLIEWYSCDVTNPPPLTGQDFKNLIGFIAAIGPATETQYRSVDSKAGAWDQKIAQLSEQSEKQVGAAARPLTDKIETASSEYSSGIASVFVIAVQDINGGSALSKFGLLQRDIVLGVNNITFKSELDAVEKIKAIDKNAIYVFNIVRQGTYLSLTNGN